MEALKQELNNPTNTTIDTTLKFNQDIVPILSSILNDLCETNDKRQLSHVTKFHAASRPPISIHDYLERIYRYADCSETCFILSLIFIDRIQTRPEFTVTSLNIHRLLITSVMLSAKFFDDHYYNNAFYARIGGIATQEINQLELEFLFMIGFSLAVTPDEYSLYFKELYAHASVLRSVTKKRRSSMHMDWNDVAPKEIKESETSPVYNTQPSPSTTVVVQSCSPAPQIDNSVNNTSYYKCLMIK